MRINGSLDPVAIAPGSDTITGSTDS